MELEPDLSSVQFLEADVAVVRQRYRRHRAGEEPEPNIVEAHAEKTGRGWRLFSVRPGAGAWVSARPGAATIPEPRKLKHVAPDYPEDAQRGRIQGSVFIECVVSPQGKVAELRVLRGIPELNKAALAAVKRWEYTPTLLDGKAVPVTMTVTVNFRLR
jgi:TonB family protein